MHRTHDRSNASRYLPSFGAGRLISALRIWSLILTLPYWFAVIAAGESFDSAYISEIVANNKAGLKDNDGDRSGWIELHNGSKGPISLRGWFLTDNGTNVTKWKLPGIVVLPDKSIVVFASRKNRTNDL